MRREHGEDGAGNGMGRQPPLSSPPGLLLLHRSFGGAWRGGERRGSGRQGRVRRSLPVVAAESGAGRGAEQIGGGEGPGGA